MWVHMEVVVVLPWVPHGGGGRLAVGAADAQGIGVVLGDGAPGLGALKDRDALGASSLDLGIVIVDGGGAHNELYVVRDVFGMVSDKHFDPLAAKALHIGAVVHV